MIDKRFMNTFHSFTDDFIYFSPTFSSNRSQPLVDGHYFALDLKTLDQFGTSSCSLGSASLLRVIEFLFPFVRTLISGRYCVIQVLLSAHPLAAIFVAVVLSIAREVMILIIGH